MDIEKLMTKIAVFGMAMLAISILWPLVTGKIDTTTQDEQTVQDLRK